MMTVQTQENWESVIENIANFDVPGFWVDYGNGHFAITADSGEVVARFDYSWEVSDWATDHREAA